ncbi:MAG: LLM class flavin-dependent oxidoreductase [Hyphomicrobiaceae bacterium]|nr:LLM class flavin-dependent oxidoreductase [Hyphomicrobiaceae bacterium]
MIKPWIFEFLYAPDARGAEVAPRAATAAFDAGVALWQRMDKLGFEGIFFSEHHFGLSYSPSPNLLISAVARSTERLRLGTMGMVLPLYQPWRVLEEIGMLDHLTGGRLEIGCASGIPQELIQIGMAGEENRDRFNEALEILDAWLDRPVISHHGQYWNFDNLRIVPRPLQQPSPPKWTTVVSNASAIKSAGRRSKICTAFESVARINEIFDAYRAEADRLGIASSPEQLAIRRNISIAPSQAEARERSQAAMQEARNVLAGDPRVRPSTSSLLDAPASKSGSGFSVHDDEFIAGTPPQVAEQIIAQCRGCGAGHILAILGRAVDEHRIRAVELFGQEVIPILRRARMA